MSRIHKGINKISLAKKRQIRYILLLENHHYVEFCNKVSLKEYIFIYRALYDTRLTRAKYKAFRCLGNILRQVNDV